MRIRYNIIFIPLLIICGLAVWYIGFREEKKVAARRLADRALLNIEEADIIELIRPEQTIRLEKGLVSQAGSSDTWRMTKPFDAACDPVAVEQVVQGILEAQSERDFSGVTPESEEEYGLRDPSMRVRLASSSGEVLMDLAVGRENPSGTARYAGFTDDRTTAFLVPIYYLQPLEVVPDELRDAHAVAFDSERLVSIQLFSPVADIQLEKRDDEWMVTKPNTFPASLHRLGILFHDLEGLMVEEFLGIDADDPELAESRVRAVLTSGDGAVTELVLHGEDIARGIFTTSSYQPTPFIVDASIYDRVALDPDVFVHILLVDFPPEQIDTVRVRQPGSENLEIQRIGAGPRDWQVVRPENVAEPAPIDFEDFITALLALQPEESIPPPSRPEDYGLQPVYFMKIEVLRRGGEQVTIYFGSRDEKGNYYSTQDSVSFFTVHRDLVTAFQSATNRLKTPAQSTG